MGVKFLVFLVVALAAGKASALSCYQCATIDSGGVLPNDNQADCANWPNAKYKAPCPDTLGTANSCQTTVGSGTYGGQTIEGTVRGCIPVSGINKCETVSDANSDGTICICSADNCNGVSIVRPLAALLALALAAKHLLV